MVVVPLIAVRIAAHAFYAVSTGRSFFSTIDADAFRSGWMMVVQLHFIAAIAVGVIALIGFLLWQAFIYITESVDE